MREIEEMPDGAPTLDELMSMRGESVHDVNGERLGKLVDVYYDKASVRPEWLGVDADLFGMRRILVPTLGARIEGDAVRIAFPKELAVDTPEVLESEISQDVERNLYAHYGLRYAYDESPTGLPARAEAPGHPPERTFERWAWPDIHRDDPLRVQAIDVAPDTSGTGVRESAGGPRRRRLRRIPGKPEGRSEPAEKARDLLRRYPEAPWFAAALAALAVAILARTVRWAVAVLRLEAVVLLGIAVIEKRRKEAMHDALAAAQRATEEPEPSVVQRVKAKVGMS